MKIYNTIKSQKEDFITLKPNEIKMYGCGPTVYNYIHIGNARPACVFDTLRRYFEYRGYNVKFVQNFTDVDDKIINKAIAENVPSQEISERYIKEYQYDAKGLNIKDAIHPKVTENIDNIINLISTLEQKGYAYAVDGDVYFDTKNFASYGKLSKMPIEDLEAGARVEIGDIKHNSTDFALWKQAKINEPYWASPWGNGRPGWHIECSAMIKEFLGETIDIHCGGQDLIFPHHENEIAQSEAATDKPLANYWMHNGYINIDNKKMSKSANNFFTVRDIAAEYGYEPIRFMMLQAHYRSPINYSTEIILQCKAALERLYSCKANLSRAVVTDCVCDVDRLNNYKDSFITAMDDDFNTADAISSIFELVKDINKTIDSGINAEYLQKATTLFNELTGVLGLVYQSDEIPDEVLELVDKRLAAKKERNFTLADDIRSQIQQLGYVIEETRSGVNIKKA